jgi:histidinol-phosphatase (PHP family)
MAPEPARDGSVTAPGCERPGRSLTELQRLPGSSALDRSRLPARNVTTGHNPAMSAYPDRSADDRDLPLDAHLHTDLSPDADVPIDVYAALAVERGIAEIAITDHVDFDPREPAYEHVPFEVRERVVREAAGRWADRVDIHFGVELTYEHRHEEAIRDHLRRYQYDFTIGSVHIGPDSPYRAESVAAWLEGRPFAEAVEPYFREVEAAARSGLFDVLGHIDFVKRYTAPRLSATDYAAAPELYEPILRALIDTGTGLEVNTSGLRQAAGETYPSAAVVARFRELGGRMVTAGSDAHRAPSFAYGLAEGYRIAAESGFGDLAFRRADGPARVEVPQRFLGHPRTLEAGPDGPAGLEGRAGSEGPFERAGAPRRSGSQA